MILAVDIGNTNIVIGCMDGNRAVFVERLSTVRTKTELEYAIDIKNVLDIYHIRKQELDGGIISSVVPQITTVAKMAVEKILKKEVLVVGAGIRTGLNIRIDNRLSWAAIWWWILSLLSQSIRCLCWYLIWGPRTRSA